MFQFKKFSIIQDKSAMKVGTDGVLLGAWAPLSKEQSILDIGTGTGLIALMMAQRSSEAVIDALEVDKDACEEAFFNFKSSDWSNRLKLYSLSLKEYSSFKKYDVIISNPPYFTDTFKSEKTKRTLARHVDGLSFKDLLSCSSSLVSDQGTCSYIIPYKEESSFVMLAETLNLFLVKRTRVKGRVDLEYKRSLLCFSKTKGKCIDNDLVIEIDRHIYTKEYIELTQPFYLKM